MFDMQRSRFPDNMHMHIVNGNYKGVGISGATSYNGGRKGLTNSAECGVGVRVLMALPGPSVVSPVKPTFLKCCFLPVVDSL
jgi:hypothetical protein